MVSSVDHGAEFLHFEDAPVLPDSLLGKKGRPGAGQADQQSDHADNGQDHGSGGYGHNKIEDALDHGLVFVQGRRAQVNHRDAGQLLYFCPVQGHGEVIRHHPHSHRHVVQAGN